MQFQRANIDMDGGLGSPLIALAVGLWALVLAVLMFRVMRSNRKRGEKLLRLVVLLAVGFLGTMPVSCVGEMGIVALESGPDVSIGFIGSPPKWIAPSVALLMASLAHACMGLWKRVLNSH